jgi:hypothetical protein
VFDVRIVPGHDQNLIGRQAAKDAENNQSGTVVFVVLGHSRSPPNFIAIALFCQNAELVSFV